MSIKTLVINPGSTSTKVGVFEDETLLFEETLRHPTEEIAKYASVIDQKDFRKEIILDFLKEKNCDPKSLNVIVGRGGLLKPIPGGTYAVSDALLADLKAGVQGQHASNLGGILAREIGDALGVPSYIVDPVVVDELTDALKARHIERLQGGSCTIELGFVLSDLLNNCERVADHCSNIAVCILRINHSDFETHGYLQNIKDTHEVNYEHALEEFGKKYALPATN